MRVPYIQVRTRFVLHYVIVLQRFHSENVSIHEFTWCAGDRNAGSTIWLHEDTVAFIRSGSLEVPGPFSKVAMDCNYLLAASRLVACTPAAGEEGSCTIVRFNPRAFAPAPADDGLLAALSSPSLFLQQWHLLCLARSGRAETQLIERAATAMIDDLRAALERTQCRPSHHHEELIASVKTSLRARAATSVRLANVASAFGVSPFTVSRVFRRQVGISMRKYGKRLRLRHALLLMFDSQAELSSIAVEAGFFDQAHFTNAFRQDFGIPPLHAFGSGNPDEIEDFGENGFRREAERKAR